MFEEHINLGEHGIKLYHDGMLIVYETPTGGDSVLLVAEQTSKLFALLEAHSATFLGEELETGGVDPYYRELSCYPDGHSQSRPVHLTIQGELTLKEGAIPIVLKKQEVASLYNFLNAHRETFQKNSSAHRNAA